ncbi:hypothetical protein Q1695_006726 [Nippostrongylus brasiliensis]|nr:hypothetical protein Q1695_006726 [Nippostrongylus brasiliensis]
MTLSPTLNLTKSCKALIQAQGKIHADLLGSIDPAAPDSLQQLSVRRDLLTAHSVDLQSAIDNVTYRRNAFFDSAYSTQDQDEDQAAIDAYLREARIDETLVETRSALSTVQSQLDIVNRLTANIRTSDPLANPTQPGNVEEPSNRSVAPNSDTGTAMRSFAPTSTTAYNYQSQSYGIAPAPPNNISGTATQSFAPTSTTAYNYQSPSYGIAPAPPNNISAPQSLLKGEAEIVLQDLDPERPNYYQLVSLLRKRYDCPHKILATLHKQLQQLSPSRGYGSDLGTLGFVFQFDSVHRLHPPYPTRNRQGRGSDQVHHYASANAAHEVSDNTSLMLVKCKATNCVSDKCTVGIRLIDAFGKIIQVQLLNKEVITLSQELPTLTKADKNFIHTHVGLSKSADAITTTHLDDEDTVERLWTLDALGLADDYDSTTGEQFQRLSSTPLWEQYAKSIDDHLAADFIEEVDEFVFDDPRVYYIPHQAVVKESSSTTKLRVVFDATSKARGACSVNDCLHQGPALLPELVGILLRARLHRFLLIADVDKV